VKKNYLYINSLLKYINNYIFAFYHLITNFTLSFILLITGFKGNIELVTEITILQAINFMVFFPFNGNARNYLLNAEDDDFKNNIFNFRLIMYVPLLTISIVIGLLFSNISPITTILLLILSSTSWFLEILITFQEKEKNTFVIKFLSVLFFLAILQYMFADEIYHNLNIFCVVLLSAYVPLNIFIILKNYKTINVTNFKIIFRDKILTQIGSTTVIGISSFALKNIILILMNKSMAGIVFMGYTLGAALATIFAYSLGPSIIYHYDLKKIKTKNILLLFTLFFLIFSISCILIYFLLDKTFANNKNLFMLCLIFSFLGSVFLVFAHSFKLYVSSRNLNLNVFKYELIINLFTVISVTILIVIFSEYGALFTYPLSGVISLIIYKSLYTNKEKNKK